MVFYVYNYATIKFAYCIRGDGLSNVLANVKIFIEAEVQFTRYNISIRIKA